MWEGLKRACWGFERLLVRLDVEGFRGLRSLGGNLWKGFERQER